MAKTPRIPVANTNNNESKAREKISFFNDQINKEWNDTYRRDFNKGLLKNEGLGDIIAFDVTSYVSGIKNYLTYGLRDHFVRLIKIFS